MNTLTPYRDIDTDQIVPGRIALIEKLAGKGMPARAIREATGEPLTAIELVLAARRRAARRRTLAWVEGVPLRMVSQEPLEREDIRLQYCIHVIRPVPAVIEDAQAEAECRRLLATIARRHGLTFSDLQAVRRHRRLTEARHEGMYQAAAETLLSLPAIGRLLHRDHTTVIHGVRAHAKRNGLPLPRGMQPGKKEFRR
ncbi:helix-turn-helix domain-containing protein [Afifella pfennigii]|uniref:helix-turn-helix domain-containing protein n=1 Tax=Afifella pfennigii TaxID=209897 RepID=UPI00047E3836|nr:helix-turn-helix domain-containing protein [Afifella pfennigii]